MTPDQAAIDAVTETIHRRGWHSRADAGELAALAVDTLRGLGWQPPRIDPTVADRHAAATAAAETDVARWTGQLTREDTTQ